MGHKVNLISVSGGKDSTAMILNAIERGIEFECCFADTGNEHQDVYDYLEYLEDRLGITIQRAKADFTRRINGKREYIKKHWALDGVPAERIELALETLKPTGVPFIDMCIWKGRFPSPKGRFCTEFIKTEPITEQVVMPLLKAGKRIRSWQGIRKAESPRRAKMVMHELSDFKVWVYRPILEWSADEVFAIHRKHGVKPNPLYLKGMNRVGCMPCVMCRKGELAEIYRRFPDVIERLRRWEKLASDASKRGCSTFFDVRPHAADKYNVHYLTDGIDAAAKWARTERGGKQFNLFTEFEEIPACSSNYGLCEFETEDS